MIKYHVKNKPNILKKGFFLVVYIVFIVISNNIIKVDPFSRINIKVCKINYSYYFSYKVCCYNN